MLARLSYYFNYQEFKFQIDFKIIKDSMKYQNGKNTYLYSNRVGSN